MRRASETSGSAFSNELSDCARATVDLMLAVYSKAKHSEDFSWIAGKGLVTSAAKTLETAS